MAEGEPTSEPTRMERVLQGVRAPIYVLFRTTAVFAYGLVIPKLDGFYLYLWLIVCALYVADLLLDIWARERRRSKPRVVEEWHGAMLLQGADAERLQKMMEALLASKQQQQPPPTTGMPN